MPVNDGQILLLNGTSSSGKSTIAKELQKILERPFMHTGIDHFLERFPQPLFVYSDGLNPPPAGGWLLTFQNDRFVSSEIGPAGLRVLGGMYSAFAALSRAGIDLIVDDVIYDPRVLRAAVEALVDLPLYFIGVRIPLELAEEREILRGDRYPGGAKFFGERVHQGMVYDFEVDSGRFSAVECAQQIKTWLERDPQPTAFQNLRREMRVARDASALLE